MSRRNPQTNAADPEQVRRADRKSKQRGDQYRHSLTDVMRTPSGRLVMWELLSRAGIYQSIWDASAKIHFNAGRQTFGLELLADIVDANEDLYQLMEREARARKRGEDLEAAAAQTPSALTEE